MIRHIQSVTRTKNGKKVVREKFWTLFLSLEYKKNWAKFLELCGNILLKDKLRMP